MFRPEAVEAGIFDDSIRPRHAAMTCDGKIAGRKTPA
jgi:hypothetical protein